MLKKNNKGFSLVELIIVIAIMVALVAVMAPAFVKYVKSSREATMSNAVESIAEFAKSEYATGKLTCPGATGTITVTPSAKSIGIALQGLTYDEGEAAFVSGCGVEGGSASTTTYKITVTPQSDGNATFVTGTVGSGT